MMPKSNVLFSSLFESSKVVLLKMDGIACLSLREEQLQKLKTQF